MALPPGYPLSAARAAELLERLRGARIAVVGDFHLDVYWHADMRRARLSRETPHFARPVVRERYVPGVGGVIAANLCALGAAAVYAVGAAGDEWRGDVLRRGLSAMGVDLAAFRTVAGRVTPAYVKPMLHGYESVQEDPRLDFQDENDLPPGEEDALLDGLESLVPGLDGIVVIDQVEDRCGGTVSARVRERLAVIARRRRELPVLVDSRARIALFEDVCVKVNRLELLRALGESDDGACDLIGSGRRLSERTGRPVFLSAGAGGMVYAHGRECGSVPAVPVAGPIDPVGAGDSASAALISALACGADLCEAASFANVVASITVRRIGETGTASPGEVRAVFACGGAGA